MIDLNLNSVTFVRNVIASFFSCSLQDGKATVSYLEDIMPSDDEDEGDAYLKRVKAEGLAAGQDADDDDDDDESGY